MPRSEANTKVAMMLALKRCPRCGHFDRGVAKHNRHNRRFAQLAAGSFVVATGLCLFAIPAVPPLVFAIVASLLVIGFFALVGVLRSRYPVSVENRVILIDSLQGDDGAY